MKEKIDTSNMQFSNSQFVYDPTKVIHNPIWDRIANDVGKGSLILGDGDLYICNYKKMIYFFILNVKLKVFT